MATEPQPPQAVAGLVVGEAVELEVRTAHVGSRVLALLLDVAVELVLFVALGVAGWATLALLANRGWADLALAEVLMVLLLVGTFVGYPVTTETVFGGRTVGKLALGLRVVRDDGGPIRFRHAVTRSLVALAVEWPGLLLPLVTWVASLATMLTNPSGKRLGDLAAGTIVIHERNPADWGWRPVMPARLRPWAAALDLTGLPDDLALAVRHYLARNRRIAEPHRTRLGYTLAAEVAGVTTPPPPPGVSGWDYLSAVIAERHRRSALRLAGRRHIVDRAFPVSTGSGRPCTDPRPGSRGSRPVPWSARSG